MRTGHHPSGSGKLAHQSSPCSLTAIRRSPIGEILDRPDLSEGILGRPNPHHGIIGGDFKDAGRFALDRYDENSCAVGQQIPGLQHDSAVLNPSFVLSWKGVLTPKRGHPWNSTLDFDSNANPLFHRVQASSDIVPALNPYNPTVRFKRTFAYRRYNRTYGLLRALSLSTGREAGGSV